LIKGFADKDLVDPDIWSKKRLKNGSMERKLHPEFAVAKD
jgi:hypothetical protein